MRFRPPLAIQPREISGIPLIQQPLKLVAQVMDRQLAATFVLQIPQVDEQGDTGTIAIIDRTRIHDDVRCFCRGHGFGGPPPNLPRRIGVQASFDDDGHDAVTSSIHTQAHRRNGRIFGHDLTSNAS
jgi:hypothetical protein